MRTMRRRTTTTTNTMTRATMIRSMADVEDEGEDKAESEAVVKEEAVVKVEDEEGDEEKVTACKL